MKKLNVIFLSLVAVMAVSGLQASDSQSWFGKTWSWLFPKTHVTRGIFSTLVQKSQNEHYACNSNAYKFAQNIVDPSNNGIEMDLNPYFSHPSYVQAFRWHRACDIAIVQTKYVLNNDRDRARLAAVFNVSKDFFDDYKASFGDSETNCDISYHPRSNSREVNCHWNGKIDQFLKNFADIADEK